MTHLFLFGILLGWGAAIPIGPINLEVVRRNLRFGTHVGITFGSGACAADVTYLVLLSLGFLHVLTTPLVLKNHWDGGALLLFWFAYRVLHSEVIETTDIKQMKRSTSLWMNFVQGYLLTLMNPMTIVFWSSISATLITTTMDGYFGTLIAGLGVLLGTLSWILGLNIFLHRTRHRLSERTMRLLNRIGGIILFIFGVLGLLHALKI